MEGAAMTQQKDLEEVYGPLARQSEHRPGDSIRYVHEGSETTGKILWVCAPRPEAEPPLHLCYVVENDGRGGFPDMVFPSDVLTSE